MKKLEIEHGVEATTGSARQNLSNLQWHTTELADLRGLQMAHIDAPRWRCWHCFGSNMGQKLKITGWISIGALAGALTTVSLQTVARGTLAPLPLEELQQLAAVFGMVKSNYVEPVDEKKLITDAIAGMVAGLDPHSVYLDKKALKDFNEGTTGKFVGVGIEISQEDGLIKVVSPIEGSPAFRAGLKPNDLIVKIDETPSRGSHSMRVSSACGVNPTPRWF
jgi:hypothetical protein